MTMSKPLSGARLERWKRQRLREICEALDKAILFGRPPAAPAFCKDCGVRLGQGNTASEGQCVACAPAAPGTDKRFLKRRHVTTPKEHAQILKLARMGWTDDAIGREVGVGRTVAGRHAQEARREMRRTAMRVGGSNRK